MFLGELSVPVILSFVKYIAPRLLRCDQGAFVSTFGRDRFIYSPLFSKTFNFLYPACFYQVLPHLIRLCPCQMFRMIFNLPLFTNFCTCVQYKIPQSHEFSFKKNNNNNDNFLFSMVSRGPSKSIVLDIHSFTIF